MLKSIEGIYDQGQIKLKENPDNIPSKTKVIVTFLDSTKPDHHQAKDEVLTNEKIEEKHLQLEEQFKERQIKIEEQQVQMQGQIIEMLKKLSNSSDS